MASNRFHWSQKQRQNGTSLTHRTVFRGSNRKHEGSVVSPSLALLSPSSLISSQGVPTLLEEELKQRNDKWENLEARQSYHSQEFCSCTCKVQRLPSARLQFGTWKLFASPIWPKLSENNVTFWSWVHPNEWPIGRKYLNSYTQQTASPCIAF